MSAGSVELKETVFEALKREVEEETGLHVVSATLIAIYSGGRFTFKGAYGDDHQGQLSHTKVHPGTKEYGIKEVSVNREELKDVWQGPICLTVTPFDDDYEVDYGRLAELTHRWVEMGMVKGKGLLKVASVMGELPQLQDDEWPAALRAVVRAADGRVDVVSCTHFKDTKRTIDDVRRAQDLGAVGIQVAPPVFNSPNQDDILRFFEAVSDGIEIGVIVYQTHWYPNGGVRAETFHRMADFEYIVAIKWSSWEGCPNEAVVGLAPKFNIFENSGDTSTREDFHRWGARGFITNFAGAYPPHELKIWDLLEAGRYDEVRALSDAVDEPLMVVRDKIRAYSGGDPRFLKAMMNVMGLRVGNSRPPTLPPTAQEMAEVREVLARVGWPVLERAAAAPAAVGV